jgi:anti-sigma factor RsiW
MDHKRYENWIFADGDLSPRDRRELHDHLAVCDRCLRLERGWRTARGKLISTAPAGPAPGFAGRWAQRLEQDNRRNRDRRYFFLLTAACTTALLYFSIYGLRILAGLSEFAGFALAKLGDLSAAASNIRMTALRMPDFTVLPSVILVPLAVMAFFALVGAGAIAWLKMFRLLARVQGLTQWA